MLKALEWDKVRRLKGSILENGSEEREVWNSCFEKPVSELVLSRVRAELDGLLLGFGRTEKVSAKGRGMERTEMTFAASRRVFSPANPRTNLRTTNISREPTWDRG